VNKHFIQRRGRRLPPLFLFSLAAVLVIGAETARSEPRPYLTIESFTYSEPLSIKDTLDNWHGDFSRGKRQWTWNWIEAGVRHEGWGLGVIARYDYDIRFSRDTAEALGQIHNKEDLPVGKTFDVKLKANVLHAHGLRMSYRFALFGVELELGGSYLRSSYMIDGGLTGKLTPTASNDFDYRLDSSYKYTDDVLFDRPGVRDTTGHGFSVDLALRGEIASTFAYRLEIRDLIARVYWADLPFTQAVATSDNKTYDENGYVHVDPVLSGFEGYRKRRTQKLEPRGQFELNWHLSSSFSAELDMRYQYRHILVGAGPGYTHKAVRTAVLFWPEGHAVSASVAAKEWSLGFMINELNRRDISVLSVSLSYNGL
jgi:hypothetical protein